MIQANGSAPQQVDLDIAVMFFNKVCEAYKAGDMPLFEATRVMLLLSLGLSTEHGVKYQSGGR